MGSGMKLANDGSSGALVLLEKTSWMPGRADDERVCLSQVLPCSLPLIAPGIDLALKLVGVSCVAGVSPDPRCGRPNGSLKLYDDDEEEEQAEKDDDKVSLELR